MLIYIDSINLFIGDDSETKSQLPIMEAGCTRGMSMSMDCMNYRPQSFI